MKVPLIGLPIQTLLTKQFALLTLLACRAGEVLSTRWRRGRR